jgi:hypothetical protein
MLMKNGFYDTSSQEAWELYKKLFYTDIGRPLTKEENEFCHMMYVAEEHKCGLDG